MDHPTVLPLPNSSAEEHSRSFTTSPVSRKLEELSLNCSTTDNALDNAVINGNAEDRSYSFFNGKEKGECQKPSPTLKQSPQRSPVKQKPPAVSKKPQISSLPQFNQQALNGKVSAQEDTTSLSDTEDQVDAPTRQISDPEKDVQREKLKEEETVESPEPVAVSCETSMFIQDESQTSPSVSEETSVDHEVCTNGEAHDEDEEEEEEEGDGTSSTTESISSKEDETGESHFHLH